MLIQSEIPKSFSNAASSYDQHAVLQQEVGQRLIACLDYMRLQPAKILDLGAGTGYITQLLKKRFRRCKIIAVDIAHPMLQQAYQKDRWWSRQNYICADANYLPLADSSVDLVVSNLMLHWTADMAHLLREIYRVLSPNGLLVFSTMGPLTLQELRNSWASVDDKTHVNPFVDMHDIGDALLQASFVDPVVDMELLTVNYSHLMDLMRDLKGIGAHNMNSERSSNLIGKKRFHQFVTAYEQYRQPNGKLPATYEVIYGHAWKTQSKKKNFVDSAGEVGVPLSQLKARA